MAKDTPILPAGSFHGPSQAEKALIAHPEATQHILVALLQPGKSSLDGGVKSKPVANKHFLFIPLSFCELPHFNATVSQLQ